MRGIMSEPQLGLEAVKFQRDTGFAKELEKIATDYWTETDGKGGDDYSFNRSYTNKMEKILSDRFGFNFKVRFKSLNNAYVIPTIIYSDNGLFRHTKEDLKGYRPSKKTLKQLKDTSFEVDLANAKVIKFPKSVTVQITIDVIWLLSLSDGYDGSGFVAVLLHEIGHQFTLLEYMADMSTYNRLLNESLKEASDKKDVDKYKIKLRGILRPDEVKDFDREVSTQNTEVWVQTSSAYMQKRLMRSSIGMYNDTSSEQVADQFASRFGYGVALLKVLTNGKPYTRVTYVLSSIAMFAWAVLNFFLFYAIMLWPILLTGPGFAIAVSMTLISSFTGLIVSSVRVSSTDEHDRLYERIQRLKRDQILMLKDVSLDKKEIKVAIEQWEELDAMVRKTTKTWSDDIWNLLVAVVEPNTSRYNSDRSFTDLVEEISINSLYVRHKQLDSLT